MELVSKYQWGPALYEFLEHSNYIEQEPWPDQQQLNAWEFAWDCNAEPYAVNTILDIHHHLMAVKRPDIAGMPRWCAISVGGQYKKNLGPDAIKSLLMDWCLEVNEKMMQFSLPLTNQGQIDREKFCKEMHVKFENIHPFEDGNGRTGRILWQLMRLQLGLPIKVIHEGKEQLEYYKWFRSSSATSERFK